MTGQLDKCRVGCVMINCTRGVVFNSVTVLRLKIVISWGQRLVHHVYQIMVFTLWLP